MASSTSGPFSLMPFARWRQLSVHFNLVYRLRELQLVVETPIAVFIARGVAKVATLHKASLKITAYRIG